MNPMLITARHSEVLHPISPNNAIGELSHEPMTQSKDNGTSNMCTDGPDLEFVDVDKGEENFVTKVNTV